MDLEEKRLLRLAEGVKSQDSWASAGYPQERRVLSSVKLILDLHHPLLRERFLLFQEAFSRGTNNDRQAEKKD
jgi:hypothetical protein